MWKNVFIFCKIFLCSNKEIKKLNIMKELVKDKYCLNVYLKSF